MSSLLHHVDKTGLTSFWITPLNAHLKKSSRSQQLSAQECVCLNVTVPN
jgi:hypothetical protein